MVQPEHVGVRDDEQWERDRDEAIRRAFETGEVVIVTRDLPDDTAPLAQHAKHDLRKVGGWGAWLGRFIRRRG